MIRMSALPETEFQPARPSRERTYGDKAVGARFGSHAATGDLEISLSLNRLDVIAVWGVRRPVAVKANHDGAAMALKTDNGTHLTAEQWATFPSRPGATPKWETR
ncbi:hypothetical protein GWE18_28435 [Bradyrhizobium sp. CSA112]|uniref:hypothetical protein n=1 Tax=Bradyrhizobium sp. CSA112 TaxID=2699170 RepID=UPI0023B01118|nr:hypothetical protein [Bradyrhizobium sp. CSA112]MDE5456686.1 hypothetical protein [Bradyrhizobium sp. CSA112]